MYHVMHLVMVMLMDGLMRSSLIGSSKMAVTMINEPSHGV